MNLNITSKTVSVETRQLKCSVTREMIEDLKAYTGFSVCAGYYKYKFENQNEINLIKEYFSDDIEREYAFYYMNKKKLRKIKLLILERNELSEILEKIIKNSVEVTTEDMLTRQLSNELSQSIDKQILNNLVNSCK